MPRKVAFLVTTRFRGAGGYASVVDKLRTKTSLHVIGLELLEKISHLDRRPRAVGIGGRGRQYLPQMNLANGAPVRFVQQWQDGIDPSR